MDNQNQKVNWNLLYNTGSMVNKILLATHNPAKLEELKIGFSNLEKQGVTILSLNDLNINEEPEETGKTFKENALLKAKFYAIKTNLPTVGDDGGLMIDILNGEPGVNSKRWLGYEASDEKLIEYALTRLKNLPVAKRKAKLQTCLCYFNPLTKETLFTEENILGHIAEKASGRPTLGYPYRALFVVEEFNKYYDEMTDEEHEKINHRLQAAKNLIGKIKNLLK
jgi:XTP/dITP diphosphohydrolase